MASREEYEGGGGIGGKFRKRPFRRAAAAKPYDRPPTALRGGRASVKAGRDAGAGWLSKFVDPASRIIASGSSRLFSSVFCKRLPPALPEAAAPEANLHSSEVVPVAVANNSSSEVQEQGDHVADKLIYKSETDEISDLEQLLKQKTFTRVEFDYLMELLRSRTVEQGSAELVANNKDKNATVSLKENGKGSYRLYGNVSVPEGRLAVPEEDAASPAEVAKAYMGSRPLKASPSSLSLRSQVSQEGTILQSDVPCSSKATYASIPPRSIVCFSGISQPSEIAHLTPITQGRSSIYKMPCSPNSKVQPTSSIKARLPAWDGYIGSSTSSQRTPTTITHSGGKQVLKRRSSVLDSDIASFGPIRRIRQKSNFVSPMKGMFSSVSLNQLPSSPIPLIKGGIHGSTSSIQKPLPINLQKYGTAVSQDTRNEDNNAFCANVAPIPPQSSEMARKILQQLDKLVPSDKEKSSELKSVARNASSSKLALDMLHGRAVRSMEDIGSSEFLNAQSSCNVEAHSDSHVLNVSQKNEKDAVNGCLKAAVSGINMPSEAGGRENAATSGQDSKSVMRTADLVFSGSGMVPSRRKPAFIISASENLLEMDDDDDSNIEDVSGSSTAVKDKLESGVSDSKAVVSEVISGKSQIQSSQSLSASGPISYKELDTKATDGPVLAEKGVFSFPFSPAPSYSQPPPTPTMQTQWKEQAAPVFSFNSKDAPMLKSSSIVTGISDSAGLKIGASNSLTATLLQNSNSDKEDKDQNSVGALKSMGNAVSSGKLTSTTPPVFSFGASTTPTLSNSSLNSTLSTFSISAAPFTVSSDTSASISSSCSTIAATSSSSLSGSSSALMSSAVPTFMNGTGSSNVVSVSVVPTLDKSEDVGERPRKASPFSFTGSGAMGTSEIANIGGSSSPVLATSYVFSSMSSASSTMGTSSVFSCSANASSCLAASSLSASSANGSSVFSVSSVFSSMASGTSSLAKSSLFTSTPTSGPAMSSLFSSASSGSSSLASSSSSISSAGDDVFAFSSSTQSSNSSLSFGNNTSQAATTFGVTVGSLFGTQATPCGSGMSSFSQSTGQSDSFSSSPIFGLNSSSSSSFGSPLFSSSASTARSSSACSVFSFSAGVLSSSSTSSSSFAPAAVPSLLISSSQPSTSSVFGSAFGSSSSSTIGYSFGSSSPLGSSPLPFGSSSVPAVSFTSAGAATSSISLSPAEPIFGMSTPAMGFNSGSQGNNQMYVEDGTADDTAQAPVPSVPTFGQPVNSSAMPNFMLNSLAQPPFQFGSHQSSSMPQSPSPFQAGGDLEVPPGGSFSLGSGGADKSGRRIVKIRRDKQRKK